MHPMCTLRNSDHQELSSAVSYTGVLLSSNIMISKLKHNLTPRKADKKFGGSSMKFESKEKVHLKPLKG